HLASPPLGPQHIPNYPPYMADKSLFIIAIDFGTSYSGYCFALESCVDQIRQVFWGMEHGFKTVKTPTCILFNEKKEFKKFGYDAVMKYNTFPASEAPKWYFFQNFKMKLYNQVSGTLKITSNMELEADNGRMLPALTVFSESLRYMKDHALNSIGEASFQTACEPEDITWVVTVPAIWDASARQFMRLAAKEILSSLHHSEGRDFSSCQQLFFLNKLTNLILWCLGGTIDITVHEIQQDKTLKELHKASGGGWGGNTVDENFKAFLREIFHGGIWDEYIKKYPTEFHQMMYNFGLQKCSSSRDDVYLHCYTNLIKVAEQKQDISLFFNHVEGTHWHDGIIMITYEKMKSFFAYSTGKIIGALKEILRKPEMATVQYILLVGGFASSIILRDEIYHTFSERYSILCPMEAQAAIVKGAVLFGYNSQIVASRISARTYGVAVCHAFDAAVHDERKKRVSKTDNYVYCTDLFKRLVGIGDLINIDEDVHYTFTPVEPDQTSMQLRFCCTEKENAKYIDEKGMKMLGSCTVPMPNPELGRNRQVRLDVKFGLTEFKATATDLTSNQSRTVMIDFLTM
uniref:Heat shock 70 kDa protein 12A-like n=1 Tax=Crocodylus porosus TaxID=8502 RepID=A0A7M4E0B3_CROPO